MEERIPKRNPDAGDRSSRRGSSVRSKAGAGKSASNAEAKDGPKPSTSSAASATPAVALDSDSALKTSAARRKDRLRSKTAATKAISGAKTGNGPGEPSPQGLKHGQFDGSASANKAVPQSANASASAEVSKPSNPKNTASSAEQRAPSTKAKPKSKARTYLKERTRTAEKIPGSDGNGTKSAPGSQPGSHPGSRPESRLGNRAHHDLKGKAERKPTSDGGTPSRKPRNKQKENAGSRFAPTAQAKTKAPAQPSAAAGLVPSAASRTLQRDKAKDKPKEIAKAKTKESKKSKKKEKEKQKPATQSSAARKSRSSARSAADFVPSIAKKPQPKIEKPKPVTKVCIRLLPADLPEHVFWRSIEPALPWFDPENAGAVAQKELLVLCGRGSELQTTATEPDRKPESEAQPAEASYPKPEGSEDVGNSAADDGTAVSPLAATRAELVAVYESKNLSRLDSEPYWRQYVPGKIHRSKSKPVQPSRAYILFATTEEVDHFFRHYHGHVFSKNNVITRAAVELAPFQYVPHLLDAESDNVEGTIDQDPDFLAFLNPKPPASNGDQQAEDTSAKPALSHVSYAAAVSVKSGASDNASSSANASTGAKPAATTPLINYLRVLKAKSKSPASLALSGGKAANVKVLMHAPGKKGSSAGSAKGSGNVTPKRSRRRNR
ncbi:hypothetical protein GGI12_000753 [Dipsacomyces acuminosporus]|nr:hypothetical protein GGI12_000753 [Dipsacomyces acuminosporus]